MSSPARSGKPDPLSTDRIVAAAVAMADARGIEHLSMRKLAADLGVGVMSLYNHVADKADLLDVMTEHVASEVETPAAGAEWRAAARDLALSAHRSLLNHPWAITPWVSRRPGPVRRRRMEYLLEVLASADLPPDLADLGFHAITNHIQGFTQQQVDYSASRSGDAGANQRFGTGIDPDEFPRVVEHVRFHLDRRHTRDEFTFVLDLILDGLGRAAEHR